MPAGSTTTTLTARFLMPDLIERGADVVLSCPLYSSGALVAPTSGTVTIYDGSNAAVVSAAVVTITGSIATYTVLAATTSSLQLSEGWRVEWALVVSGVTESPRNDAALVRAKLFPCITDADLYRLEGGLDPSVSGVVHNLTTFQPKIDEAFAQIQIRLIAKGNRPNLVISPYALRNSLLFKTLELAFSDLSTQNESWQLKRTQYAQAYRDAWNEMTFLYDKTDDGAAEDIKKRRSASPGFFLGSRGTSWRY